MKALAVGGSGFIGSHVVERLLLEHWDVLNYGLHNFAPEVRYDPFQYRFVEGSMMDYPKLSNTMCEYRPDVVYNFAAIANIEQCQKRPLDVVRKNILGNTHCLQSVVDVMRENDPVADNPFNVHPKFIFASSVYVYNTDAGFYGIGKRACEELIREYSEQFCFPFVILRYGTIYGPRAKDDNSIRSIVKQALETKVISYYGTGEEVREYVHVKDVARCSVEVLHPEYNNEAVIISGTYPVKAKDMVALLSDILGENYSTEFRGEEPEGHYKVTPYSFQPDVAVKKSIRDSRDLASGLYDTVRSIYGEMVVE